MEYINYLLVLHKKVREKKTVRHTQRTKVEAKRKKNMFFSSSEKLFFTIFFFFIYVCQEKLKQIIIEVLFCVFFLDGGKVGFFLVHDANKNEKHDIDLHFIK